MKAALDGRVILISGASSGIGHAAALDCARLGARVFAGVRAASSGAELESQSKGLRGRVQPVLLDVTNDEAVKKAAAFALAEGGRIDAVINNAGIAVAGPAEALSLDDYRRQFEVNVYGVIRLTQACLPHLRTSKGRVINVSSINGRIASPFLSAYAASKFAIEGFSDALRRELADDGVAVAIIEPGPIKTPIWEKSFSAGMQFLERLTPEMKAVYGARLEKFRGIVERTAEQAKPIEDVLIALRHALCADSPRVRYAIGADGFVAIRLTELLPDRWMDGILKKAMNAGKKMR